MNPDEYRITVWLEENDNEPFASQYGPVTNQEWLEHEQRRIPGTIIMQNPKWGKPHKFIALFYNEVILAA